MEALDSVTARRGAGGHIAGSFLRAHVFFVDNILETFL